MGKRVLTSYNVWENVNTTRANHKKVRINLQNPLWHAFKILVIASVLEKVGQFQDELFLQYGKRISAKSLRSTV